MTLLETDPIDVLLDANGDIDLSSGNFRFSSGLDGVAQAIRIRLSLFKGEWFLDLDAGVPYLDRDNVTEAEAILGQKFDEVKVLRTFRTEIADTPGVDEILTLTADFDNLTRNLSVTWVARTAFGDTPPDSLLVPL